MSDASGMLSSTRPGQSSPFGRLRAVRYKIVGIKQPKLNPLKLIELTLTERLTKVPFN